MIDGREVPEQGDTKNAQELSEATLNEQFKSFTDKIIPDYKRISRAEKHWLDPDKKLFVYQSGIDGQVARIYHAPNNEKKVRQGGDAFSPLARAFFNKKKEGDGYELTGVDRHGEDYGQEMRLTIFNDYANVAFQLLGRKVNLYYDTKGNLRDIGSSNYFNDYEHQPGDWGLSINEIRENDPEVVFDKNDSIRTSFLVEEDMIRLQCQRARQRSAEVIEIDSKLASGELRIEDLTQDQRFMLDFFGPDSDPQLEEVVYKIPLKIDHQNIRQMLAPESSGLLDDPYNAWPEADSRWMPADILRIVGIQKEMPESSKPLSHHSNK